MTRIKKSELVLNTEGALYHINLVPGDAATTIMLVGDPGRVELVSSFFDTIDLRKQNREINTVTGTYKGKRLTVMSTGMGVDNVEIVVNELDALFNVDLENKVEKEQKTTLNLIRVGTSGALREEIPVVDSYLVSEYAVGLDGMAYFYKKGSEAMETTLTNEFIKMLSWDSHMPRPYGVRASDYLIEKLGHGWRKGITLTAPGFYAPQGRELRLQVEDNTIISRAAQFEYKGAKVSNFEMETSSLYILSKMLGHNALTVCDIIANRITDDFNPDYKSSMEHLVKEMLNRLVEV